MFEYLMPLLFTQTHENSLLDRACYDAVRCQIVYARQNHVPWGISESAFSALDRHNVYQYRAFGVPALALKRGQEDDLVVAPYAAALALGVEPAAAMKNLRRLANLGDATLLGEYGYYEAIDYSRRTELDGAAGIIIHCYMVHHQGMSLLAYGNALHDNAMRRRFHSDPRIRATEPLLHEHIPEQILPTTGEGHEERPVRQTIATVGAAAVVQTPEISSPRIHLLSNGTCSVTVTNSGGGYLRWLDLDVTRWRADPTCDLVGAVLLHPGFGKWNDLEQHPSTREISRAPLHLEFHARQSGVSAAEWALRDDHRNCHLRRRRRGSPTSDFGEYVAQTLSTGAD